MLNKKLGLWLKYEHLMKEEIGKLTAYNNRKESFLYVCRIWHVNTLHWNVSSRETVMMP